MSHKECLKFRPSMDLSDVATVEELAENCPNPHTKMTLQTLFILRGIFRALNRDTGSVLLHHTNNVDIMRTIFHSTIHSELLLPT